MGNQQASYNSNNKEKRELIIDTKSKEGNNQNDFENLKDSSSSYKGVKTIKDSDTDSYKKNENEVSNKDKESTECQTIPENSDFKDLKIPTLFEWKEGGENIYIAGNFSNWSQWHMMNKINNKFVLTLVYIILYIYIFIYFYFILFLYYFYIIFIGIT
jgi:hypothetical protein